MKMYLLILLGAMAQAFGMTPGEFAALYATPRKNADTCYKLYEAYRSGDGVPKNDSQARKWLLAAHSCGMISTRNEIASLPWRQQKKKLVAADPGDDVARQKGEQLIRVLKDCYGHGGGVAIASVPHPLSKDEMKAVKRLVAEGADLNIALFDPKTLLLESALSLACQNGDLALADYLIDRGADPSANSNLALEASLSPDSSLGLPAGKGKPQRTPQDKLSARMIGFLVHNGADLRMWTDSGWTTAMIPVFNNSPWGLALLVQAGADPNQRMNPHEYVAAAGHPKRIEYRFQGGKVAERSRPLAFAIDNAQVALVEQLIRLKADVKTPGENGLTPLGRARARLKEDEARGSANPEFAARRNKIISLLKAAGSPESPGAGAR